MGAVEWHEKIHVGGGPSQLIVFSVFFAALLILHDQCLQLTDFSIFRGKIGLQNENSSSNRENAAKILNLRLMLVCPINLRGQCVDQLSLLKWHQLKVLLQKLSGDNQVSKRNTFMY